MCLVFKKYTVFRWSLYGQLLALYYDISRLKYVIQLTTFSKLKGSPKKRDLPSKKKKKTATDLTKTCTSSECVGILDLRQVYTLRVNENTSLETFTVLVYEHE